MTAASVVELWRYPVKSLQGERLDRAEIGARGIAGDRHWAIVDVATGLALTARREPVLLDAGARLTPGGVEIVLPGARTACDDRSLSEWLGRPVALVEASAERRATYESPLDAEDEIDGPWETWQGPAGSFHDSARTQVSLVSTSAMGAWDRRRFRANVVLDGVDEVDLVGRRVLLGTACLRVVKRIGRCVMVTRAQPGLERDLDVLRTIVRERDGCLAVGAVVDRTGSVAPGDRAEVAG